MGKVYQHIEQFLSDSATGIFVEIGSDRGEGSTAYLDSLARSRHTQLVTVDISSKAKSRWGDQLTNTEFVVSAGSKWAQQYSAECANITVLYLDNFDYIWEINNVRPAIQMQMQEYADRGTPMTNQACQVEHLAQLISLYPFLHSSAVVAFDDTYCYNDCWIGKCGPGVIYLLAQGWHVVHQSPDCGVIMTRLDKH